MSLPKIKFYQFNRVENVIVKLLLCFLITITITSSSIAQSKARFISGIARFTNTGEIGEGVRIELYFLESNKKIKVTKTNSAGRFSFHNIRAAKYILKYGGNRILPNNTAIYCRDYQAVNLVKKSKSNILLIIEGCA